MKTRSKKPSTKNDAPEKPATTTSSAPPAADPNPPKLFVLPKDVSSQAHIVTLPNPASSSANRYFCCPNKGFYEFTRVAAPKTALKSWLLAPERSGAPEQQRKETESEDSEEAVNSLRNGYTLKSPDIFVATPVDALFLVLPALVPSAKGGEKQLFLSVEDHMDSLGSSSAQLRKLLQNDTLRARVEERMAAACDTVDAGDEKMFRLSIGKLAGELLAKAERLTANGLPASMEEKFVRKALERPVMSIKREETTVSLVSEGAETATTEIVESQTTTATTTDVEMTIDSQKSYDHAATPATADQQTTSPTQQPIDAPEGIPHLLRLRTAIDFMSSSYLPPSVRALLRSTWSSNRIVDFNPLDKHLQELAALRSEAQALRSLSDNITRKHGMEDDEAAAVRAEKKRKKDEEETKKKNQSRGVKQLAKADTSGMKKLSSFFTKAPVKK